jgi:hypothetical protein
VSPDDRTFWRGASIAAAGIALVVVAAGYMDITAAERQAAWAEAHHCLRVDYTWNGYPIYRCDDGQIWLRNQMPVLE